MQRKIAIVPILAAMLMVMFTTLVPHHHHQAMICLVREVCRIDGCCDDEHTAHSDANHDDDEAHCLSHEKYSPSDNLRLDCPPIITGMVSVPKPGPQQLAFPGASLSLTDPHHSPPPLLTWRINR